MASFLSKDTIIDHIEKCSAATNETIELYYNEGEETDCKSDKTEFSMWNKVGDKFFPSIDTSVVLTLPKGVYKMNYDSQYQQYSFQPCTISSDNLYHFSENYSVDIIKEVLSFWDKREEFIKHGLIHKRGILLAGPPGTGKSSIISLVTEELLKNNGLIFLINSLKEFEMAHYLLPHVIKKIEPNRPIVTIIEDIDKLIRANGNDDSMILDFLDGKSSIDNHLVILTSNDTSELSSALLRPSRIDLHFELPCPNEQTRKEFLMFKGVSEEEATQIASKTEGMSFAELKEIFISTQVLSKDLDTVINQLKNPLEVKNYLSKNTSSKIGI